MAFYGHKITQKNLQSRSQHSMPTHSIFNLELFTESYRERKEHEVYLALLRMVPGLEERLMTGDTDTLQSVAMQVSQKSCLYHCLLAIQAFNLSCKRVPQVQGQTIQKV